jgi:two-component system sensor histidine kinase UhpB
LFKHCEKELNQIYHHIRQAAAVFIIVVSVLVLIGWQADLPLFKQVLNRTVAMNPMIAVAFLCAGFSFLLLLRKTPSTSQRSFAKALAAMVVLIALLRLAASFRLADTGIDRWLFPSKITATLYNDLPNFITPNAAIALLLTGSSLLCFAFQRTKEMQWFALPVTAIGMLSMIGYTYHLGAFYSDTTFTPLSFHTGICLLIFSIALLFTDSKQGLVSEITNLNAGGKAARLLLPACILFPFIIGYFVLNDLSNNRIPEALWISLFVTSIILIFCLLIWMTARIINKSEAERQKEKQVADEKLRQAAEHVLDLYNNAPCGYHTFNREGLIIDINSTELNWLGYSREEVISRLRFTDILTPDSRSRFDVLFPLYLKTGIIKDFIVDIIRKNGTIFPALLSANAVKDDAGNLLHSRATILDYTERKKQDDRIKQFNQELEKQVQLQTKEIITKEQQFRFLMENMQQGVQLLDFEWRYLFVNKALIKQSRIAEEGEFVGVKITDKFPRFEHTSQFAVMQKCMTNRVAESLETEYEFADGSKGWFQISIQPVPEGLFVLSKEITEQKLAEYESLQSQKRYHTLMNSVDGIVWEADAQTLAFSFVSEQAERLLGYPTERWITEPDFWASHIYEADRTWAVNYCAQSTREGKSHQFEYRMIAADGRILWLRDVVAVIMENKVPVRLSGIMVDITETKKMEAELSNKMIAQQKLITETTILAQEKERNELGLELHDNINQLLSVVKLYLGIAKTEETYNKEIIEKSFQHLEEAITDIRNLSHSLVTPTLGKDGLKEALKDLASSVPHHKNIRLQVLVDDSYTNLTVDKNKELMIYRIVQAQITNILKYAKASEVTIALKSQHNSLNLTVADNGVGFDTELSTGKGIGLKNINSRVDYYSGQMRVLSAPGKGCTLEVFIPN